MTRPSLGLRTGPYEGGVDREGARPPAGLNPAAAVATRAETGGVRRGLSNFPMDQLLQVSLPGLGDLSFRLLGRLLGAVLFDLDLESLEPFRLDRLYQK